MHRHLLRSCCLFMLLWVGCPAVGNGDRVSETRHVTQFERVDNDSSLEVVIEQGEAFDVRVSIDSNLIDRVRTEVSGDRLHIWTRSPLGMFGVVRGPHVRITMPKLTELDVSGAGDADALGFEDSASVRLSVSGAGDLHWDGAAEVLSARVSGAGDLVVGGRCDALTLSVSGAGDADARDLTASSADVSVSGAGDARLTVDGEVSVQASGAGDVDIYGDAELVDRERSGAGEIRVHRGT